MQLSDTDRDMMIRTVIGEAGDQSDIGKSAVAHVIMNRVASGQWGDNPTSVVLARGQFEPWQTRARQLRSINPKSADYQNVGEIVDSVVSGGSPDPTKGATHFLDPAIVRRRRGGSLPDWAQGPGLAIGDHTFYAPNGPSNGIAAINASLRGGSGGMPSSALPFSDDELNATARALGINRGGAVAAPAAVEHTPQDIADTAAAMGITLGGVKEKPALPAEIKNPPPADFSEREKERLRTVGAGFPGAVIEGAPIVGPGLQATTAAGAAALQPLTQDTGGTTFGDRFSQNLADIRASNALYAQEHPILSPTGNALGAFAATGPFGMTNVGGRMLGTVGSNVGSRFYQGTLGGAGIGGLDAAMRGENPLTGAEVGGAFGAGGVLLGHGLENAIIAGNALRSGSGPLAPVGSVGRTWLTNALANETPASRLAAGARMGPEGFIADINPSTTDLAAGLAARAEPPASAQISEAYRLRAAGQPGRINAALDTAFGGPPTNIVQHMQDLRNARSTAADPLYEAWRNTQVHPTDALKQLLPRLESAGAFDEAERLSGITGEPINRNFFTTGPRKDYPTTQSWDYVKRGLDSQIDQAYRAGNNTRARALVGLRQDLITEIQRTPAGRIWQQARREYAEPSALIEQIAAGRDTFLGGRSGTTVDELRAELAGLSAPELVARREGTRSAVNDAMGDSIRGDTALRDRLLANNNQQKLRLLLGNGPANDLINTLQQERYLGGQTQYVRPQQGSPTAGRTAAANALNPPPLPHWDPNITSPLSWVPPAWLDALRPSTVMQGGREASYAAARRQMAPVLLTRAGDQGYQPLLDAIAAESGRRAQVAGRANMLARGATRLITGPGSETARLRGQFGDLGNALVVPAR